jgi:diacylglycerol kinase
MTHWSPQPLSGPRYWVRKFRHAFRGVRQGVRDQSSFAVHLFAALAVIVAGFVLQVERLEWCLLLLCVTAVLVAELFNTSLELISRTITRDFDERLRDALDIASGAVLLVAVGAVGVGALVFGVRLAALFSAG